MLNLVTYSHEFKFYSIDLDTIFLPTSFCALCYNFVYSPTGPLHLPTVNTSLMEYNKINKKKHSLRTLVLLFFLHVSEFRVFINIYHLFKNI